MSGVTTGNPAIAEGWVDWGSFYTQTYVSLLGIDGSTVEMCHASAELRERDRARAPERVLRAGRRLHRDDRLRDELQVPE